MVRANMDPIRSATLFRHSLEVSSLSTVGAHSAHSAPELRRTPYLSTFGFRKEGVCSGYQLGAIFLARVNSHREK